MPKFEVLKGGEESSPEKLKEELARLIEKYSCGTDKKPEWYVHGKSHDGGRGVLFWITPCEEAEFIAHQMARLETELGGSATAEKTGHHPEPPKMPRYKNRDGMDNLVFGGD